MKQLAASLAAIVLAVSGCATQPPAASWPHPTLHGAKPLLIAHRGASGDRPEHTIEGYKLALAQGADCIEPDLVITKDGVLIARHDTFLSTTTNVADHPEFASRKRASPDPEFKDRSDWWVADFTLAEIKTLRARQSFKGRSAEFDGKYEIPTFAEVLQLAKANRTAAGKPVCVYPEAKSPAYHASLGHDMLKPITQELAKFGYDRPGAPIFFQCFEPPFVKRAFEAKLPYPVILLAASKADYEHELTLPGAPFWNGVGVTHQMVADEMGRSTGLIEAAHKQGVAVHVWTYRTDAPPYPPYSAEVAEHQALALGLDGFFTDFPASGRNSIDTAATGTISVFKP
jgi:glycerophosphoryl diester phosphodiesterase